VLATNDEPRETAAFCFTAAEAQRTGRPVRLVHVVHGSAPRPHHPLSYSVEEVNLEGERLLRHARGRLEAMSDGPLELTTELLSGRVVDRLLACSADAASVVLSRRGLPHRTPLSHGSVSTALAGRAISPLVSVPQSWQPDGGFVRRVVLGLGEHDHPCRLVEAAFKQATLHGARLLVLHAVDERAVLRAEDEQPEEDHRHLVSEEVAQATAPFRARYPEVDVAHEVVTGSPEECLLALTSPHDLLVVGRRDAGRPVYEHLGSLTRTLLRSSAVPLVVVPRPQDPPRRPV
jgi:nucleotide-binding universal stress UspA family protein